MGINNRAPSPPRRPQRPLVVEVPRRVRLHQLYAWAQSVDCGLNLSHDGRHLVFTEQKRRNT